MSTRRKLIQALPLCLTDTPFGAERIAQLCGFGNRTYFHRVFKQVTGVTPREYRAAEHTSLTALEAVAH